MNYELFHIQWHITEKCNLRCIHCYREPYRKELTLTELKLLADKIVSFVKQLNRKLVLTITGGEPFLKPKVYDLADYVSGFDIVESINFITNGTIIPDEKLKQLAKLSKIYISLESDTAELNDKIRGKGSFEKVITNLPYFVKNYNTGLMTTLLNTNIDYLIEHLPTFVSTFFNYGVKEIIFERFIPAGEAKKVKHEQVFIDKILLFYKKIAQVYDINFDELKLYPAVKIVANNTEVEIYGAECVVGRHGCAILCDGTVYPCRRFDKEIFNMFNTTTPVLMYNHNNSELVKTLKPDNDSVKTFTCYAMLYSKSF